jgi:hypothetical protein
VAANLLEPPTHLAENLVILRLKPKLFLLQVPTVRLVSLFFDAYKYDLLVKRPSF